MEWVTDFNTTTPDDRRVEYQHLRQQGCSWAESRDRVTVAGRVVHTGYVSDHKGFEEYKRLEEEGESPAS